MRAAIANALFDGAIRSLHSAKNGFEAGLDDDQVCQHLDDCMTDIAKLLEGFDAKAESEADEER